MAAETGYPGYSRNEETILLPQGAAFTVFEALAKMSTIDRRSKRAQLRCCGSAGRMKP